MLQPSQMYCWCTHVLPSCTHTHTPQRSCRPSRATIQVLSKVAQKEMVRYLYNHQNPDGGFGLHIEGESTMFGTGLRWAAGNPHVSCMVYANSWG